MKERISRRDFIKGFTAVGASAGAVAMVASLSGCSGLPGDPGADIFTNNLTVYNNITLGGVTKNAWPAGSGSGDVIAPATNTDSYIPQWNGANSKTLKDGLAVPAGGLAGITALNGKLGTTLNNTNIFVGNGSNVATGVAMSGDASISNTGVIGVNKTRLNIRNETGTTIASTRAVYVIGFNNLPLIALADNTQEIKHNVVGVTIEPIADQANGYIATTGQCDAETNAWTVGTELYLSNDGTLTSTAPTSGGVQHIAIVTVKESYPVGKLLIYKYPEENYLAGGSGVDTILRTGDDAGTNKFSFRNYSNTEKASINSLGVINSASLTASQILGTDASKNIVSIGVVQSATISAPLTTTQAFSVIGAAAPTIAISAASTTGAGSCPIAVAPAANYLNVVGITNAETLYSNKALLTATAPANVTVVVAASSGTSLEAAHRDHVHGIAHAITDNSILTIDDAAAASGDIAKFTANGVEGVLASTITAGKATVLETTRAINGVNFDGSAPITVTADASTLTGTTLKTTVVTSANLRVNRAVDTNTTARTISGASIVAGTIWELTGTTGRTLTFDTGTNISTAAGGSTVGDTFTVYIKCSGTSSGTITLAGAAGATLQSSAVVAIGTMRTCLVRCTGANAWTIY